MNNSATRATSSVTIQVYLTPLQVKKYESKHEIKITNNAFNHRPNYIIKIDKKDIKYINNVKKGTLLSYNIKYNPNIIKGGFLPLIPIIAGVVGALGAAAGGVSSIVNSINNKRVNDQLIEQKKRQNDILERQNREGKPINVNKITANEYASALTGKGFRREHATKQPLGLSIKGRAISTNNKVITTVY
ncbi:hypothetical protein AHEVV1_006 [Adoxophyes honmai entomopoxvirus 'L' virophage 1]|nr:hypothetical protein AHEVV1_006 [Adoxophyes honmai entomopoxvirus 'L' virophage 1]